VENMTLLRAALRNIALVCSLVLVGCASMNEETLRQFRAEMDGYVGRSADELILSRGVPTASVALSTGAKVLEYSTSRTSISGGTSYATYTPVFVPNASGGGTWISVPSHQSSPIHTSERSCKLTFQVSSDNTVLNWKAEGNDCRPVARP
jgi:hypothetical protein